MGSVPAATPTVREIWRAQRADGPAAVLAIGTANPEKCVPQEEFPDFFFRATNSDHLQYREAKPERLLFSTFTAGEISGSSPLRRPPRRREGRGTQDLRFRHVDRREIGVRATGVSAATNKVSAAGIRRSGGRICFPDGDGEAASASLSDHLTALKDKFKRVCLKLGVQKRYLHHTEELLRAHPEFIDHESPSLDARLDIVATAVPELAAQASKKAIAEWGRPATDITHLVVTTNSGAHIPGVDFRLIPLLGLRPSVRRTMLYLNGCFAGSAALRLAKDLAENNRGARVLVVCAELTLMLFSGPKEGCFQTLINQGLFGDGAAAVIVGAEPDSTSHEHPLFEIVSAAQTVVPGSDHAINMHLTKGGYGGNISTREVPGFIGDNIEQCLHDSFGPLSVAARWNDLFWAVHPGSSAILDHIDMVLKLQPDKLAASRRVLSEYGNMFGVTIIFVLDELRRRHKEQQGAGLPEWGVMITFGPGLTVETMVLRATHHTQASV